MHLYNIFIFPVKVNLIANDERVCLFMQHINQPPSFCSVLLSKQDGEQIAEENDVKWTATTVFMSSSDTVCGRILLYLFMLKTIPFADRSHSVHVLACYLTTPRRSS